MMATLTREKSMYWIYNWGIPVAGFFVLFVFTRLTWPSANVFFANLWSEVSNNKSAETNGVENNTIEPGINFGGVSIYVSQDKIIAWTTIKLMDKYGKESYIEDISPRNFTILETHNKKTRTATIYNLEHTEKERSVKAILLIDNSGSMKEPSGVARSAKSEYTKMQIAKKAAVDFVGLTQAEATNIAVLPFAGEKTSRDSFIKAPDGQIWWSRSQASTLKKSISALQADGNTPLWEAIDVALEQYRNLSDASYNVIICLTDGQNTKERIPYFHLLEKVGQKHIPIYTLGYGTHEKLNEKELIELAIESGAGKQGMGSFIRLHPKDWVDKLKEIRTNITKLYEISWAPTVTTIGAQVSVKIKIEYKIQEERYEKEYPLSYVFTPDN
jgi:Mg-chelatase subunit ChlD